MLRLITVPCCSTATQTLSYSVTFLVTSGITATQVVPVTATSTVISVSLHKSAHVEALSLIPIDCSSNDDCVPCWPGWGW